MTVDAVGLTARVNLESCDCSSLLFFRTLPCKVFKDSYVFPIFAHINSQVSCTSWPLIVILIQFEENSQCVWIKLTLCLMPPPDKQTGQQWQSSSWVWNIDLSMELMWLWRCKKSKKGYSLVTSGALHLFNGCCTQRSEKNCRNTAKRSKPTVSQSLG